MSRFCKVVLPNQYCIFQPITMLLLYPLFPFSFSLCIFLQEKNSHTTDDEVAYNEQNIHTNMFVHNDNIDISQLHRVALRFVLQKALSTETQLTSSIIHAIPKNSPFSYNLSIWSWQTDIKGKTHLHYFITILTDTVWWKKTEREKWSEIR